MHLTKESPMSNKKQPSKNNNTNTKKPIKKPTASVNKGGRPPGKMTEEAKFARDTRHRVRQLTKISEAHLPNALTDLDTAKTVCTLIRATHEIHSSLFNGKSPNVAVQINNNNNGEKTNTEEVLKILQKKHKEIKND